jgi:hypothetical protein
VYEVGHNQIEFDVLCGTCCRSVMTLFFNFSVETENCKILLVGNLHSNILVD